MLGILIEKELKAILLSPKFSATFAVCSVLIILSVFVGIQEFKSYTAESEVSANLLSQNLSEQTRWQNLRTRTYRSPDPMQIFAAGIHNDIGKRSDIETVTTIKLANSNYSENTVFAVFRFLDLTFIVQVVLSLFAILFTYDAINGERESGTLKLNFANSLPRSQYILAKLIGSWLGLVLPLMISLLIGVLLILLYNIPMTGAHWVQLCGFLLTSVLYFTFFICLGLLVSSLTRHSSTAFLFLLVIWISSVFIIPRVGVMVAGQIVSVPTATEISMQLSQKSNELMAVYSSKALELNQQVNDLTRGIFESTENVEESIREQQLIRNEYQGYQQDALDVAAQEIQKFDRSLNEDWRNRQAVRERLGYSLSRISPASSFQLAVMELAGTGTKLKTSAEDQMRTYANNFQNYRLAKLDNMPFAIVSNPEPLDLSDMPEFEFKSVDVETAIQESLLDIALLAFYTLMVLAGTFFAFLRYDVR